MKIKKEDVDKGFKKIRRDEGMSAPPLLSKPHRNKKKYTRKNKHKHKEQ